MQVSKLMRAFLVMAVLALSVGIVACGDDDDSGGAGASSGATTSSSEGGGEQVKLAVILKDGSSPFWLAARKGAQAGADELGDKVDVTIDAGASEQDIQGQIAKVEAAITRGVKAIAIAPSAPDQLKPVLQRALDQDIAVLLLDTNINGFDATTFIGTDNVTAGKQAGTTVSELIGGKGKVGLLVGAPGVTSVEDRVKGFMEAKGDGIEVVAQLRTDCDQTKGLNATQDLLTKHPDISAIFSGCGLPAVAAAEALKQKGIGLDKIKLVGFDATPQEVTNIEAGTASASIAQYPDKMGQIGVEKAYEVASGGTIDKVIDSGSAVVTKDNAADFK